MERKTRKKSALVTTIVIIIALLFILVILIVGITYFSKSAHSKQSNEMQEKEIQEELIKKENTVILYKVKNFRNSRFLYVNQYGYIIENNSSSAIILEGITLQDNQEQISFTIFENLRNLHEILSRNDLINIVDKIDIADINNIKVYIDSENKVIELGNFENLSIKFTYAKKIMEQEKDKKGTIFVNDIEKVFFRESI